MQLTALLPLLALLATPVLSRSDLHPHAAAHRRHIKHDRAVARVAAAAHRRDELAQANPRALEHKPKKRVVKKRGAGGCRAKNSTSTAFESATASVTSEVAETAAATDSTSSSEATAAETVATDAATAADAAETVSATSTEAAVATDAASSSADAEATSSSSLEAVAAYESAAESSSTAASSTSDSSESVASSTTSSAAAATSTVSVSTTGQYTPNSIKAGIAGGDAYDQIGGHIGWWYDWSAVPSGHTGAPIAVNMLWGDGSVDATDASRLAAFKAITTAPQYIIGFEEPDCSTSGSSNIGVSVAAALWDSTIAPWKDQGSVLLSPSMCHQAAEQYTGWLSSFSSQISTSWDVTNIHVNKNSMDGVKADIDYYYNTYGKPIWVTEFACVDDSTDFVPCTDQSEINTFIQDIVNLFEADERVHAYAYSNGDGLSDEWMMVVDGTLTESGQTYITAVAQYH
ncbi:hypothetical protein IAT38_006983 [Cryptococcus sp. DSM 104549]